ncbi:MAG: hypothetical protein P9L96_00430 [Candidatus Gygaella obscura]|nr:hypothetical protein [Candidatus Gygaella obscura]
MTEKAILINSYSQLKYFKRNKFSRIYWGVEFCQNLFPSLSDTKKIINFCCCNRIEFTLITPFFTGKNIDKLRNTILLLRKQRKRYEVVVNDWGSIYLLNREFSGKFTLSLGRLLTRQQRDPFMQLFINKQKILPIKKSDGRIVVIFHEVNKKFLKAMQSSYVGTEYFFRLAKKLKIDRVELNNLVQGVNLNSISLKKTLYYPFVNISTGRFCPMDTPNQRKFRIGVCKKDCLGYYDILKPNDLGFPLFKRGNTTFYKIPLKAELIKGSADRTVFQPELPF